MDKSGLLESKGYVWWVHLEIIQLLSNDGVQVVPIFSLNFTVVEHVVNVTRLLIQNQILSPSELDHFGNFRVNLINILSSEFLGLLQVPFCLIDNNLEVFFFLNNMLDGRDGLLVARDVVYTDIVCKLDIFESQVSHHRSNSWKVLQSDDPLWRIQRILLKLTVDPFPIRKLVWVRNFRRSERRSREVGVKSLIG